MTHRVELTLWPGEVVELPDHEYLDLKRLGAIAREVAEELEPAPVKNPRKTAANK